MTFNKIILGAGALLSLYIAYSTGHRTGLKDAPETVALRIAEQATINQDWAEWTAEYNSSQEKVCDQIFELVLEYEDDTLSVEQRERGDEF